MIGINIGADNHGDIRIHPVTYVVEISIFGKWKLMHEHPNDFKKYTLHLCQNCVNFSFCGNGINCFALSQFFKWCDENDLSFSVSSPCRDWISIRFATPDEATLFYMRFA